MDKQASPLDIAKDTYDDKQDHTMDMAMDTSMDPLQ